MPAFVTDGPDIPEHLLQAQEEGRLVFFCGPGVGLPAGLPDTRGQINKLYRTLDTTRTPVEQQAFRNRQFDAVLELLERRQPGQRAAVREALATVLKPRWRKKGALDIHRALLQLATDRGGKVRLVTSNVDHVFRRVIARDKLAVPELVAPQLPLPRPDRWHGLVYLHGLLEQQETPFNRLVLSSGDFGLAYLGERWAARFVSELRRHFTVCFVGYELHDPVLRYLMDALAVEEVPGVERSQAWVLASYREGARDRVELEWQSRGLAPLLYRLPRGSRRHEALYGTLQAWAASYRDGVRSRRMIIAQHAATPPLTVSRADHAVGRVLWALGDGEAAKHFAELNPVPPLAWLEPLAAALFEARDLPGPGPGLPVDEESAQRFSLLHRPAPAAFAARMSLLLEDRCEADWDEVMLQLGRWLTRHLGDPALPAWLARRGAALHPRFAALLRERVAELDQLLADGNQQQLDHILAAAPRAVPGPFERCLWRLFLAGRVPVAGGDSGLLECLAQIKREGASASARLALRDQLRPCVAPAGVAGQSSVPLTWLSRPGPQSWMLVPAGGDGVAALLREQREDPAWQRQLPDLLPEFNALLQDARALAGELAAAQAAADGSPSQGGSSIVEEPHSPALVLLIELVRDAWLATAESDPERAGQLAAEQPALPPAVAEDEAPARATSRAPGSRRELVAWLRENPGSDDDAEDDWLLRCREGFLISAYALYALAQEGIWPTARWRDGLRVWAEEEFLSRSWRYVAPVLNDAPDAVLQALAGNLSHWLRATARSLDGHEGIFTGLCHRLLLQDYPAADPGQVDGADPVERAGQHPVGTVTLALLEWWYSSGPTDGAGLPELLEPVFTALCADRSEVLRHSRVLLAAHGVALSRAAPTWAEAQLLPLLQWQQRPDEAVAIWQGFLHAPQVCGPMLPLIGPALLDTAAHYRELGAAGEQYATFLTLVALEPDAAVADTELAAALALLPPEGLRYSARALAGALAGAGGQHTEYWHHRVQPLLRELWPAPGQQRMPELADSLVELCIAAGSCFPAAVRELGPCLQPVRYPDYWLQQLQATSLCRQFPGACLELVAAVIDDQVPFSPDQLQHCLETIRQVDEDLTSDRRYSHLTALTDRRGVA